MSISSLSPETVMFLFVAALAAGFVDSIAGGGGLIALPALLSTGMPAQLALGTNKLQGTFGAFTASVQYLRHGTVALRDCGTGIVATFVGAAAGTWTVQRLDPVFMRHVIPPLLVVVLLYTLWSKGLGDRECPPRMGTLPFFLVFGVSLGFYDGFFGPGTGSFWTAACCLFLGADMRRASGITRVMNFVSNVVSLALFLMGGQVLVAVGLIMALGQVIGARVGSGMAIQRGASFIRPVFALVVAATIGRLVYLNYVR